jgi:4-aminobutyrate aminotransferase/(S)-3-amino-2-methylpropionate transaminase
MLFKAETSESVASAVVFEREQELIAPGTQTIALLSHLVISHGKGSSLIDVDGKRYLDFSAGVSVASLGHGHPAYVSAMKAQLERYTVGSYTSTVRLELLELIDQLAIGKLRRVQLFSGGAEAVEAAIRLARCYTGRTTIVGFTGCFHGKTAGVLPLSDVAWKHEVGPLATGYAIAEYPDPYRFDGTAAECAEAALRSLRNVIASEAGGKPAAIIIEPIQGTAGNVVPPPGFLRGVRQIARECGALLIADEMITAFGRTGAMFGCTHDGVEPDIMTVGKGMGNGFPVSAIISTDEIVQAKPFSLPSASSSSYGGNPLAACAALATLRTILAEGLVERSRDMGTLLLQGLRRLQDKYDFIGEVRGKGLLIGVDLVSDRSTRAPLAKEHCIRFFHACVDRGLIQMGYNPRVRINPPLTLSEADANLGLQIMDGAFAEVAKRI